MLNRLKKLSIPARITILAGVVLLSVFLVLPIPNPNDCPSSTVILDKDGKILRVYLNSEEQFLYPLSGKQGVPNKIITAITTYEDKHFYAHPGINPIALFRAMKLNMQSNSIISGGSTITMQAVGLQKRNKRNYFNKFIEIITALKWELFYSKDTILRSYCNNAPYGSNIVGVRTASFKYFGRDLQQLTWAESSLLAILPNNPGALYPGCNPIPLMEKRNRLLSKLYKIGKMDLSTYESAITEPIPSKILAFPFHAPHLADELKISNHGMTNYTTIDSKLQKTIEAIAHRQKYRYSHLGIKNFSVLITERKTGKVRAYLGSQDFRDNNSNGQVNGVKALRSTGSILKPFLYAAAIDDGLMNPKTLLTDTKLHYMLFAPENYDSQYRGVVTAEDALRKSLNIPAIRLLEQYGAFKFYTLLKDAGLSSLFRTYSEYGLSLVIGGAEASLISVTNLYLQLANGSTYSPVHWMNENIEQRNALNISKGAKWLTLEMLKNNNFSPVEISGHKSIAVKTGTSFGNRDAWAVGVTSDWIVSVWAGNFTGESNPEILSFTAAVPLLKSIYKTLPSLCDEKWFYMPEASMHKQKICLDTGYYPSPDCVDTEDIFLPDEAKPMQVCPYHKTVTYDKATGYGVCSKCWSDIETDKASFLEFPPSVTTILNSRNTGLKLAPLHNPECPVATSYNKPEILYPIENSIVMLPRDFGALQQELVLKASHSDHNIKLFWYLDGDSIGETKTKHSLSIAPESGEHKLKLVDSNGSSCSVRFTIQ